MELQKVADNTYEFIFNKNTSKEDLEKMATAFQQFKEREEQINLLGVLESFPTLDSMLSISELFKVKLNSLKVVQKYAILADKNWLKKLMPVANFLTPSLPVKSFSLDEKEAALNWLTEKEVKEYKPEEYLTGVDIEKLNPTSYKISLDNETIDLAAMSALNNILSKANEGEKVNLMVVLNNIPSIESFKTLIQGLKVDFKIFGRLAKYAVVTDANWIEAYGKFGDFVTPGIEMKTFPVTAIDEAKAWVLS